MLAEYQPYRSSEAEGAYEQRKQLSGSRNIAVPRKRLQHVVVVQRHLDHGRAENNPYHVESTHEVVHELQPRWYVCKYEQRL